MTRLYLIRGLPGSGKTHLAEQLIRSGAVDEHFENDMFFLGDDGEYRYDPSRMGEAIEWCLEHTRQALSSGSNVVVSNTFSRYFEVQPYLLLCDKKTDIQIFMCFGQWTNVHDVPDERIHEMAYRWEWF